MELQLIRSFVEVAESGSFAAASDRLFVTQSAVSLRIQRLEEQLGRPLFTRSKDGVTLTAAGREFRSFAITIIRNWEQARQRVSAAEDVTASLTIAAQPSLWPRLGFRWIDALRAAVPGLQLRAEMGRAEALTPMLLSGQAQVMLTYTPVARTGLITEPLFEEQLVLVASYEGAELTDLGTQYVLIDWGPDFMRFHEEALPHLHDARLVMALGALSGRYLTSRPGAAYLPARYVKQYVGQGRLYLVPDAPVFALPGWAVWREDVESELKNVAQETLAAAVERAEEDAAELLDLL